MKNLIIILLILILHTPFAEPQIIEPQKDVAKPMLYTLQAIDNNIEGNVLLSFIINEHGQADSIEIISGLGYGLDQIAAREVAAITSFGNKSKTPLKFVLPVRFSLNSITPRQWSDYYVYRGNKKFYNDDFAGAIEDYNLAISANSENPEAYYMRAQVLFTIGASARGCNDLRKAKKGGYKVREEYFSECM